MLTDFLAFSHMSCRTDGSPGWGILRKGTSFHPETSPLDFTEECDPIAVSAQLSVLLLATTATTQIEAVASISPWALLSQTVN